jgi:hypothetical protein
MEGAGQGMGLGKGEREEKQNRKDESKDGVGIFSDNTRNTGSNLKRWARCVRH